MEMTISLQQRYRGALLGLACGDALGTTVEFKSRGSFAELTTICGGGPFGLQAGQWTDDTSMALCLAESLIAKQCCDPRDQMTRYLNWYHWGYLSSTGDCFDIGNVTRHALNQFNDSGLVLDANTRETSAGNGSLMRLAPVALFYAQDTAQLLEMAALSSRTTHSAPACIEACQLFALALQAALAGKSKPEVLNLSGLPVQHPELIKIASGKYQQKSRDEILGSGYVVESLEAALWCFFKADTLQEALLMAANLGNDADTTAAITGQIAGAYYGCEAIPEPWLQTLYMADEIRDYADQLFVLRYRPG